MKEGLTGGEPPTAAGKMRANGFGASVLPASANARRKDKAWKRPREPINEQGEPVPKLCDIANCPRHVYSAWVVAPLTAIFSLLVIGPRLADSYVAMSNVNFAFQGVVQSSLWSWCIIWIATVAISVFERSNHIFTILINSLGIPGFILGVAHFAALG